MTHLSFLLKFIEIRKSNKKTNKMGRRLRHKLHGKSYEIL
jgi:hypothetical protein